MKCIKIYESLINNRLNWCIIYKHKHINLTTIKKLKSTKYHLKTKNKTHDLKVQILNEL